MHVVYDGFVTFSSVQN